MARFYYWKNNGVTAVMPEATFQSMVECLRKDPIVGYQFADFRPIFTFSDVPHLRSWVTGTNEDMRRLLAGHELVASRAVYVPFSNGREMSTGKYRGDLVSGEVEWSFHTTIGEVMDVFGLARVLQA